MSKNICTWIYCDSLDEESSYTQVGNNSSDVAFQEVYWRCVYVFFCSSIKNNPTANHILFTNSNRIPRIDDFPLEAELARLKVKIIQLPLTFKTPQGYFSSWRNQFYIFDILRYIGNHYDGDDCFVILDSDCIWVRSADSLMDTIKREKLMIYNMPFQQNEDIHGLSREQMKGIYEELLDRNITELPEYAGGEWFGATASYIRILNNEVSWVWEGNLRRYQEGKLKFNEEAHMLSYLYFISNINPALANSYIRRIWTVTSIRRDVQNSDPNLTIWHCPSEKKYAIKRLYNILIQEGSEFWDVQAGDSFVDYIGKFFGIPIESERKYSVEQEIRKQIDMLREIDKDIVIFGSGNYGQSVLKLLIESGLTPRCFVDNNNNNWTRDIQGIPIEGPREIRKSDFIVIASYASLEIKEQLINMKLCETEDFLIYNYYSS
jgi:hypothetical protein